jgi:hypothetical protein
MELTDHGLDSLMGIATQMIAEEDERQLSKFVQLLRYRCHERGDRDDRQREISIIS